MANNLTKSGITSNSTIEAWHVTQSIDAFTGQEAYNINLSGSLSVTGSLQGNNYLLNSTNLIFTGSSIISGSCTISGSNIIYTNINDITGQSGQLINNINAGTSAAAALFFRNNDNKGFEIGVVSSTHTTYQDAYGRLSDSFYTTVVGSGDMIFKQRASGKGIKFFNSGNGVVSGQSTMNISDNGVGFYTDSISAVIHIKGTGITNSTFPLKIENSSSLNILKTRDDGLIINYITGSSPLTSSLNNNEMTSYLDESNNKLMFLVKYSNGTIKSGSINLV